MAIDINIPIEDAVTDGSLNPVTSNAVFDGLALKANSADLATVATSGDYNDLDNLPTIPAAQVNADWNATSGVAEILNKPTIPSVTGFVPYTGATTNVDLGTHKLTTKDLVVNHPSGSGVAASITKGGSGEALTVVKSSGSGNAASITGGVTLIDELHLTTDLADTYIASAATWNAKQAALVSGTNIKTVNGNSLLGSGDLVISGGGGAIAVGTTAVTSGTVGRVFFQGTGDVVQQSGSLFWDGTNNRLGIGTSNPATGTSLDVNGRIKASIISADAVNNTLNTVTLLQFTVTGNRLYDNSGAHVVNIRSGNFGIGIGATTPAARLDVRAQGALSTDIAFRVRNSADSDNLFSVNGIGNLALRASSGTEPFTIHHSGTLQTKLEVASNSGLLRIYNAGVLRHDIDGRDYASFKGIKINAAGLGFNYLNIQGGTNSRVNVDIAGDPIFDIFNASNLNVLRIDSRVDEGLLQCKNAGVPSTSITDGFKQYSADIVAGNAAPHFRTENGNIIKLYRETTAVTASAFVSNTSLIVDDSATYGGYTMGQVVAALKAQGLLA